MVVERGGGARDQLVGRDEAEVVGGQGGEQAHADVGGRGAVGDARLGDLLEVVGRQPVIVGAGEGGEVAPGVARHAFEVAAVLGAELELRAARPGG